MGPKSSSIQRVVLFLLVNRHFSCKMLKLNSQLRHDVFEPFFPGRFRISSEADFFDRHYFI